MSTSVESPVVVRSEGTGSRPAVLFFATDVAKQSGASYALRETIRRVTARGTRAVVVIPDLPDSREMFPASEFDVVYLKINRVRRTLNPSVQARYLFAFGPTLARLRKIIREKQVDILHFNEITDFIGGMAARMSGIPAVCHVRADGIPNPFRAILLWMLSRLTDAVVVPSKSTSEWMVADRPGLESRINLIYDYAFDITPYDPAISGAAFREEVGIPADATMVTLVSKLHVMKGHICFIKAAEQVMNQTDKVRFVMVGGALEGHDEDAKEITELARELTPEPYMKLVGPRSDLPVVYAASDITVHCPIYPDPYPTVVLLAMLMGKPVIGSDIGGIPEQIDHERTGLLVPPDDPSALAQAIIELTEDKAKRESIGAAGMEFIRNAFDPDEQGRRLEELYADVLARCRA